MIFPSVRVYFIQNGEILLGMGWGEKANRLLFAAGKPRLFESNWLWPIRIINTIQTRSNFLRAGNGGDCALAGAVIVAFSTKTCAWDAIFLVKPHFSDWDLSPSVVVPGLPGFRQLTARSLGPLKTPSICRRVCGAATGVFELWRDRKYPGTSEIQCVGCGLPGNLKWLRVEPKPEHCRAWLAGASPASRWGPGPLLPICK